MLVQSCVRTARPVGSLARQVLRNGAKVRLITRGTSTQLNTSISIRIANLNLSYSVTHLPRVLLPPNTPHGHPQSRLEPVLQRLQVVPWRGTLWVNQHTQ